ncbi:hypothetical protein LRP88_11193 [Fusarium phalaenopsidis]
MMPQEGDWNAGGSIVYINATRDEVFPAVLTDNNTLGDACKVTGNELCPSWQWEALNTQIISKFPSSGQVDDGLFAKRPPREIYVSGPLATLVNLVVDIREKWFNLNSPNHTVAMMPHFAPAEACVVSSLHWEQAAGNSAKAKQSRFSLYSKIEHRLESSMAISHTSKGYAPFSDSIATSLGGSWIGNPTYGRRVRIEPSFAEYLNPQGSRTKRTVIHEMILSSGVWTSDGEGSRSPEHLEAFLGGLATPITTLADPKGEWWKSFMPQDGNVFGAGGSPYAVSSDDEARFYKTEMETWVTGFAFADSSLTMRGAVAVFYVYALFVIVYSVWSIWSGITSSSWGSVPDLLALALADKKPPNASRALEDDGFKSADIMKENYCISADGGTLRLRPTHGPVPYENRVKPNEAYD